MAEPPLTVNAFRKEYMEYKDKFGHNLGRIQKNSIISRINIC